MAWFKLRSQLLKRLMSFCSLNVKYKKQVHPSNELIYLLLKPLFTLKGKFFQKKFSDDSTNTSFSVFLLELYCNCMQFPYFNQQNQSFQSFSKKKDLLKWESFSLTIILFRFRFQFTLSMPGNERDTTEIYPNKGSQP